MKSPKFYLRSDMIYNNISDIPKLKFYIKQSLFKALKNKSPNRKDLLNMYINLKPHI